MWGSSPLARGLQPSACRKTPTGRIIPARAGFTSGRMAYRPPPADHPRSRGVYPRPGGTDRPRPRIIPARAGFTPKIALGVPITGDHPRSRGVYHLGFLSVGAVFGSSPLARGLRRERGKPAVIPRIIPARAGFTPGACRTLRPPLDHPRSRGVYRPPGESNPRAPGSSPLARGLLCVCLGWGVRAGIIPARAGFTFRKTLQFLGRKDHPRSRGVY